MIRLPSFSRRVREGVAASTLLAAALWAAPASPGLAAPPRSLPPDSTSREPLPTRAIGPRWPTWPTEVSLIASSFETAERRSEDERYSALLALDEYPTAAIAAVVAGAIDDPATSVQRQAMGMCVARRILACQPAAAKRALTKDAELSTRVRALEVIALDATRDEWTTILVEAIDDPLPGLQIAALGLVGFAPIAPAREAELAVRLRAKLADTDPEVRAAACRALGLRGDVRSLPLLLAALEDPDPVVIEAAVEAIPALGNPGALPALARTLENASTPALQRKAILAIAALPGRAAEDLLLDRLRAGNDATRDWIARAAAARRDASDVFLRDVAALLRDPDLHVHAERLLAEHGPRAHAVLRDVLDAGLEPAMAATVSDILTVATRSTTVHTPTPSTLQAAADEPRFAVMTPTQPSGSRAASPAESVLARRWARARSAAASGRSTPQLALLQATVDDALSTAQPPSLWVESLWALLRATTGERPATRRDHARLRWSPLAAARLEHHTRDPGAPSWLRCAAWTALATTPLSRRQRMSLRRFRDAVLANPAAHVPMAACLRAWPLDATHPRTDASPRPTRSLETSPGPRKR